MHRFGTAASRVARRRAAAALGQPPAGARSPGEGAAGDQGRARWGGSSWRRRLSGAYPDHPRPGRINRSGEWEPSRPERGRAAGGEGSSEAVGEPSPSPLLSGSAFAEPGAAVAGVTVETADQGGDGVREGEGPAAAAADRARLAPHATPASEEEVAALASFLAGHERTLVVTGAGISTESGIPDYRSPDGAYSTGFKPMTNQLFESGPVQRARYWARSFAGWYRMAGVEPNAGHRAVAELQRLGYIDRVITQNVDGLHQRAGARGVLELHGTIHEAVCGACGERTGREELQQQMERANPEAAEAAKALTRRGASHSTRESGDDRTADAVGGGATPRPVTPAGELRGDDGGAGGDDGDAAAARATAAGPGGAWPVRVGAAELVPPGVGRGPSTAGARAGATRAEPASAAGGGATGRAAETVRRPLTVRPDGDIEFGISAPFSMPRCPSCGKPELKPAVVFFGDSLPKERAVESLLWAEQADAVLVVGSTLTVFSAFRLARAAARAGADLAIATAGPTRADGLEVFRTRARAGDILSRALARLKARQGAGAGEAWRRRRVGRRD